MLYPTGKSRVRGGVPAGALGNMGKSGPNQTSRVLRSLRPTRATKPDSSAAGSSAVSFPPFSVSGILGNPHFHAHDGGRFNDEFNEKVLAVCGFHLFVLNAKALMPATLADVVNDVFANPVHKRLSFSACALLYRPSSIRPIHGLCRCQRERQHFSQRKKPP